jgi:hypothetical protein
MISVHEYSGYGLEEGCSLKCLGSNLKETRQTSEQNEFDERQMSIINVVVMAIIVNIL